MGNRALIPLGIAACALLVTYLLSRRGDPELAPGETTAPAAEVAATMPVSAATTPIFDDSRATAPPSADFWFDYLAGDDEPLTTFAEDPHAVAIRGRLTVRQRQWVHPAGIDIRLTRSLLDTVVPSDADSTEEHAPTSDDPTATTDEEGYFSFRFRPTRSELFFLIDRGGPWMDFQRVRDLPRPGEQLDLGDVLVDDRGAISGRLVGPPGIELGGSVLRAVDAPLQAQASELGELRTERNRDAERFHANGTLSTAPVPDWAVRRERFLPFPIGVADDQGFFVIRGLRPGVHDVFVQALRGSACVVGVQVAAERCTEIGAVRLAETTAVKLTFVDEEFKPWVGAEIGLVHAASGYGTPIQRTNADGAITAEVHGEHEIVFGYPGGGPWMQLGRNNYPSSVLRSIRRQPLEGTLTVDRPIEVAIALVDMSGNPVRNGRVRLFQQVRAFRAVDRALPGGMQPVAKSDGTFSCRIPCLATAVAGAPGFAPAVTAIAPDPQNRLTTITMMPLQTVTVRVHDSHRQPIAGAAVRLRAYGSEDLRFRGAQWGLLAKDHALAGYTGEDGTLAVPVWGTVMAFTAEHPDYARAASPRQVPHPGQDIDLELAAAASLKGRLLFNSQPGPAGYRLRATMRPTPGDPRARSTWIEDQVAVIGDGGVFAFRGLAPGFWDLQPELPRVPGPDGATNVERVFKKTKIMLEEGHELWREVEAELEPMATAQITGSVTIDGFRIPDALIRITPVGQGKHGRSLPPDEQHRLSTDAFGEFVCGGLQPHTRYEVRIDVRDNDRLQFLRREVVYVESDSREPWRMDVDLGGTTLTLRVLQGRQPFANRMLRLRQVDKRDDDGACWEVLTSQHGECWIEHLPAGKWTVEPVHGGLCEPGEITIEPGVPVAMTVEALAK